MVQEILGGSEQVSAAEEASLRERFADALFKCAVPGEHNYANLRGKVLATMMAPPPKSA
jgi:hypothetical protein